MSSLASRFNSLFTGLGRSHGEYSVPPGAKADAKGKLQGKALTVHTAVTEELWTRHLEGINSFGLGVVPITDEATCSWGAIDIDVYPLDLVSLNTKTLTFFPLLLCRTKSGGAHLYLFMKEPVPAVRVRDTLVKWAAALGYPGTEVFPKQIKLASINDDGNWINMPYQAGGRTTRYALGADGKSLTPEQFLERAHELMVSEEALDTFELPSPPRTSTRNDDMFEGSPPCLETLSDRGFPQGTRNNALFNIAVYLKKRYGEAWEGYLDDYNQRFMDPPIDIADIRQIQKSVNKKSYGYKCKDQPICSACNKQECLTRTFGVSGNLTDPGVALGEIVKVMTDPPIWIWDVNGIRFELDADDIMDQRRFHKAAFTKINKWPTMLKPNVWQDLVRDRLERIRVTDAPPDAAPAGLLWIHLQNFCTSKVKGKTIDEILAGKPYTENGRANFRAIDFIKHLQQERVSGMTGKAIFQALRGKGVEYRKITIKGKTVDCWSVPAFDEQTEDFDVPVKKVEEM